MTELRSVAVAIAIALVLVPSLSLLAEERHPLLLPVEPKFVEKLATLDTLAKLRGGGFVLYLRHGATDTTIPDRLPNVDLNDCSTQRPLTDEGKFMSAQIGKFIRQAGISVDELRSSPLCRAKESAIAAFPDRSLIIDNDLIYTANLSSRQKEKIVDHLKQLLSTPVPESTNRMLVAHAPNLMDIIGYFPKELTLVIFRPRKAGGFDYISSIPSTLWPTLLH